MVELDFGLPPDTDNVFHIKEIQDMVNVIQRMIKDGERCPALDVADSSSYHTITKFSPL